MRSKRLIAVPVVVAILATLALSMASTARPVNADDGHDNDRGRVQVIPYTFVGNAGDCGTGYPAGSRIVTATWLTGFGLPDNGGPNAGTMPGDEPNKRDPHTGLLLSKNGPTPDCSSADARVTGVSGLTVTTTFELGFDYRDGTHCGAGAPRFNVVTADGVDHFFGCADGTSTPAPQDPTQWMRVRFTAAQGYPPVTAGERVRSIEIVFDEGTDTPTAQDPNGAGLVNLDNIDINGMIVTSGPLGQNPQDENGPGHEDDGPGHGHGRDH